uniref:Uncharacterized protein n=1 Tax=Zooxanthella nutricula TaxID=1333877 RepID=A0A7S2Q1K7_9DINO
MHLAANASVGGAWVVTRPGAALLGQAAPQEAVAHCATVGGTSAAAGQPQLAAVHEHAVARPAQEAGASGDAELRSTLVGLKQFLATQGWMPSAAGGKVCDQDCAAQFKVQLDAQRSIVAQFWSGML